MEIEGKIILDLGKQEGTSKAGNHWQKREWVLETVNTQFPRKVKFHIFGDRADQMMFELGKNYIISYDLESREFNGRWYTDVSCYAMRESGAGGAMPGQQMQQPASPFGQMPPMQPAAPAAPAFGQAENLAAPMGGDQTDDLPF